MSAYCPPAVRARIEADIAEESRASRMRELFAVRQMPRPAPARAKVGLGSALFTQKLARDRYANRLLEAGFALALEPAALAPGSFYCYAAGRQFVGVVVAPFVR